MKIWQFTCTDKMQEVSDESLLIKEKEHVLDWMQRIGISIDACSEYGDKNYAHVLIFHSNTSDGRYLAKFSIGLAFKPEYVYLHSYPDLLGFLNTGLPIINDSYQIEIFKHLLNPHSMEDGLAVTLTEIIQQIKEETKSY